MRKRRNILILLLLLLLLLLWLLWMGLRKPVPGSWRGFLRGLWKASPAVVVAPAAPVIAPVPTPTSVPRLPAHNALPKSVAPPAVPLIPSKPIVSSFTTTAPVAPPPPPPPAIPPGQEGMHRELIPKNITIVRCYYDEEIVAPGETFGFDINGSGFTESFQQMISVDLDGLDLQVMNLNLVTANEIHGQIQVGPEATTQYNYPVIVIRNLPVFKATDPFGVVRPGEVLDVVLTSIDDSGQFGKFQVITNLNDAQFGRVRITPTTPQLDVSNIVSALPFRINGSISIAPGLSSGQYGLLVTSGGHELFRKDPLVDVVRPDVGKTGSIDGLKALDAAHRPGDMLEIKMTGSGFTPTEANLLTARVDSFTTGTASFSWVSQGRIDIHLPIPYNMPEGVYGMTIFDKDKQVFQKKTVFGIVPVNWLSGLWLPQPLVPGKPGTVQLKGRAITPDYARTIAVATDEPGLAISGIHWQDSSDIAIDLQIAPTVAPGDYILHVGAGSTPITLPQGNIIKITP